MFRRLSRKPSPDGNGNLPEKTRLSSAELGRIGEEVAARFLQRRGWRILERNWRHGRLELDLIGRDGAVLVFVEVKTRTAGGPGCPADALTPAKKAQVCKAAQVWLSRHDAWGEACRFDVVCLTHDGTTFNVEHMPDAFPFSDRRHTLDRRNAAWQPW